MNENKLAVVYHGVSVGELIQTVDRRVGFQYSDEWLGDGFSLNPFSLPLKRGVFIPKYEPFDGLYGVFADSLPDGWGRLLVDRFLAKKGLNPHTVNAIERLAIVGAGGMGALEYQPAQSFTLMVPGLELDTIAAECSEVLADRPCEGLDRLFTLGGSSGGARPKILTMLDGEPWIVKFPSRYDGENIGREEYDYAECARHCGLEVAATRLMPSSIHAGYFATRRFDRRGEAKVYMASVAALLETSHRVPNLDYHLLMKLTRILCKDSTELMKMFRLMCFNVLAHNRDDHSKNFSYLYNDAEKRWTLAPAYDLTYSYSLNGEHATTINGEGQNPTMDDILAVARQAGLNVAMAQRIAADIKECVLAELGVYLKRG